MDIKTFLNTPVSRLCGVQERKGNLFGLELELEGRNVALNDVATRGWSRHHDGSLRGESVEYTTAGAKSFDETTKLVNNLFKKFGEHKVKFKDSIRTSTHVHLNFSDKPAKSVFNFFALFTLLEEVLQYYSGEDRRGNLFCISTREAEGVIKSLFDCLREQRFNIFARDRYKYSACNLSTLYKFGTVEVRTMRGAETAEQVNTWVSILNDMYGYSLNMSSPVELIRDLSHLTADGLMRKIFKQKNYEELMRTFPPINTLHYSLMEGARIIQVLAYSFEEDFLAKVDIKEFLPKKGELLVNHRGGLCAIWKPDGTCWFVAPRGVHRPRENENRVWRDGERVNDDQRIYWDQHRERFMVDYPEGPVPCNWRTHPVLGDEGPPAHPRPMPRDFDFENLGFDDEEIELEDDDEGEDF